jgi:hypothetical protein
MSKLVKARMWDAVKEDGRLGYRGAPGIAAHVTAVVSLARFNLFHLSRRALVIIKSG